MRQYSRGKDIIKNKQGLDVYVEQKNTTEKSRIFCDKIEYIHDWQRFMGKRVLNHHLMFWSGKELVFRVYLRTNKPYKDIYEALEDVGITVVNSVWDDCKTKNKKRHLLNT